MLYVIGGDGRNVLKTWHVGTKLDMTEQEIVEHARLVQADGDEFLAIKRQGFPVNHGSTVTYLYGDLAKTFLLNIRVR